MEDSKTSFCSSEFPFALERILFGICRKFGHALTKFSLALS